VNIPTPIKVFGWFLLVVGLIFSILYAFFPGGAVPGLDASISANHLAVELIAVRAISQTVLMLIALLSGKARFLQGVFIMRIITEVGDQIALIASGNVMVPALVIIILIVVGEAWSIYTLSRLKDA
jgi:hypothetical protein